MTTASGIPQGLVDFAEPAMSGDGFPAGNGWAMVALTELPHRPCAVYVAVDGVDALVEAIAFLEPAHAGAWVEWSHVDDEGRDVYLITAGDLVLV